jgi:Signal transduction histidine kinase
VIVYFSYDYYKYNKKLKALHYALHLDHIYLENIPVPENALEDSYYSLIEKIIQANIVLNNQKDTSYHELSDYMTLWVHQIKTPIAGLRLLIQSGELSPRLLSMQILRIEQYVDMMMYYVKMGHMNQDLKIGHYKIGDIVNGVVKKQSLFFIHKKISLNLEELDEEIVTDEKWTSFIIEQILSNALKYTKEGSIRIYMKGYTLYIEDTGIGIKKEDLPRVFEKGFTGTNGRIDKKASGLGLYLVKNICDTLGYPIHIESEVNKGTTVSVCFEKNL